MLLIYKLFLYIGSFCPETVRDEMAGGFDTQSTCRVLLEVFWASDMMIEMIQASEL